MAYHAPYIMPGGPGTKNLGQVLRAEKEKGDEAVKRGKSTKRGKDLQFLQILSQRTRLQGTSAESELAELKALESVGARRRRRWLNDKTLRDMAGPLTAQDIHNQFNPVPFGSYMPSVLTQISQPENAELWDNFRNIDVDKEARVLQKWSEHNRQLHSSLAASKAAPDSPAQAALRCWSRVGKKAKQALRKANVHAVLQLETQILEFLELGQKEERLVMAMDQGFGRLLVHGLADFYTLLSCSKVVNSETCVVVYHRPQVEVAPHHPEVTCTDVLLALAEVGRDGVLTHQELQDYVTNHIHGAAESHREEWVLV